MVESTADRFGSACQRWGDAQECERPAWLRGSVTLVGVKLIKMPSSTILGGAIRFGSGTVSVDTANSCWQSTARIQANLIGSRVRLYGLDNYPNLPVPLEGYRPSMSRLGYFAYEPVK
jgi:hypothetical protein